MKKSLLLTVSLFITGMVFCQTNYNWYKPEGKAVEQELKSPPPVCGMNEGCEWTYSEMMQDVQNYINCMGNKQSVLIDESAFEYDSYDYHQMGTAFCWGYAHHSSVMLPGIVELKY